MGPRSVAELTTILPSPVSCAIQLVMASDSSHYEVDDELAVKIRNALCRHYKRRLATFRHAYLHQLVYQVDRFRTIAGPIRHRPAREHTEGEIVGLDFVQHLQSVVERIGSSHASSSSSECGKLVGAIVALLDQSNDNPAPIGLTGVAIDGGLPP
jgi:hypothetical protein